MDKISHEASGVLHVMLSLPDDWEIHQNWLMKTGTGCGRDKMRRIMSELEEAGYLIRTTTRSVSGNITGVDWEVIEEPLRTTVNGNSGCSDKQCDTDNINTGTTCKVGGDIQGLVNAPYKELTIQRTNKDIKTMCDSEESPEIRQKESFQENDLIEEGFNIFYQSGLVKKSKSQSIKAFTKIVKKEKCNPVELGNLLRRDIQTKLSNNEFGFNKLHPSTYLNQERWTDETTNNNELTKTDGRLSASERITQANNQRYSQQGSSGLGLAEDGRHISRSLDTRAGERTIERMDTVTIESWDD